MKWMIEEDEKGLGRIA